MRIPRRLLLSCLALATAGMLAGCTYLRSRDRAEDDAQGASAAKVDEARARYTLQIEAPRALRRLLAENLDLARFRDTPSGEALTLEELDRLVAAAPEQVRALLATEGYFSPVVQAQRLPTPAGERPIARVEVQPGPRSFVTEAAVQVQGELQQRADAGDADARRLLQELQDGWLLKPGQPFQQSAWAAAKNDALGRLHAGGYPTAIWLGTDAAVRSQQQQVALSATAQSGPRFHFGELRIEGLQRYDERVVRNLATFGPGTPYTEQRLLDFQDRLTRSGLFEGAVAEVEMNAEKAQAAPATVRVQEQRLQQVTLGLGYSTDTGARVTVEHIHRQPFGLRWTTQNKLEAGPQRKAWEFDYRSYPQRGFERNLVAGMVERWKGTDEERDALRLRLGRSWENPRLERQVYAEYNNARVRAPAGDSRAQSLTGHYDWTRRDVDSLLLPTRGTALLLQGAAGYSRSSTADHGPLARAYGRLLYFKPFAKDWHATLRLEAGQVFARQSVGVPDTLLFRAGGQDSVRGYDYRSLGPQVNGTVTSGRALLTASAEVARPLSQRLPQLWGAAFVDAGNAARRFGDLKPVVGAGVGVRYRSPIGPLNVDVAYGFEDRKVRVHLTAGASF